MQSKKKIQSWKKFRLKDQNVKKIKKENQIWWIKKYMMFTHAKLSQVGFHKQIHQNFDSLWWQDLSYLPNPSARARYNTRSIFKRSLTGLSSEFSIS